MPKRRPSIMKARRPARDMRSPIQVATGLYPYSWAIGGFRQRRAPTPVELVAAWRDAVFMCSTINAQAVASVPFRLYGTSKRGTKEVTRLYPTKPVPQSRVKDLLGHSAMGRKIAAAENVVEITDHPLLDLFEHVNPWMDKFGLFELTVLYLQILGAAYWTFGQGAFGRTTQIWPLPSWMVYPVPDTSGHDVIQEFIYTAMGGQATLARDEVLYFRSTNLFDPYVMGFGELRAGYLFADTFDKIQDYQCSVLENRARPDAVLLPKDDTIGWEEIQRHNQEFRQQFGLSGAGGVYVAPGGMDLKPLSWSPRDMGELAEAKQALHNVARTFKVPVALIDNESANRANMDAALLQHARQAVLPLCRHLEESINSNLVPRFDDRLVFAFDNPVPADEAMERENIKVFVGIGLMARNEARAKLGLPPVDGGDVLLVPSSVVPLDRALSPPDPRIIMPDGPAHPDELPDATRDPSEEFDAANDEHDGHDEPFEEGDDVASQSAPSGKALADGDGEGDEHRDPFRSEPGVPSIRSLMDEALHALGHTLEEYDADELTEVERRRVLHQLRLDARAWLRGEARKALAEIQAAEGIELTDVPALTPATTPGPSPKAASLGGSARTKGLGKKAKEIAGRFFERTGRFVRNALTAAALTVLGPGATTLAEVEGVRQAQAEQMDYLTGFERDLASGEQSLDGTFVSRAEMYGASTWNGGVNILRTVALDARIFNEEKRVHVGPRSRKDPCVICDEQEQLGWQPVGTLRPIGDSPCRSACHCHFVFRTPSGNEWSAGRRRLDRLVSGSAE